MDSRISISSGRMSNANPNSQSFPLFKDSDAIENLGFQDNAFNGDAQGYYKYASGELNYEAKGLVLDGNYHEDYDFSDVVLKYINHILLEEDVEDEDFMFQESAALQAAEKSFYEVIGQQYPASGCYQNEVFTDQSADLPDTKFSGESASSWLRSDPTWRPLQGSLAHHASVLQPASSYGSSCLAETTDDFSASTYGNHGVFSDSNSAVQFKRGVEEAQKYLPRLSSLGLDMKEGDSVRMSRGKVDESVRRSSTKTVAKLEEDSHDSSRGKKNPYHDSLDLDADRSSKQSSIHIGSSVSADMYDEVLLSDRWTNELRHELSAIVGKIHGKNPRRKRNVVDLRTLLIHCAQAIVADDTAAANDFLKQIRQHASPNGDGMQRLAYYFADGLEARMAGSGTKIYKSLNGIPASSVDILKAYRVYLATCPYRNISHFFANKAILSVSQDAKKLHIVDFGIEYGFQWPAFLKQLASRHGDLKLRITGIDLPCSGFRPSQRVEETGRHLARCAETFNVPFEFHVIAKRWETIKLEDIKIENDELLVVNCLFRLRHLMDETVAVNSPRNRVLSLIRKMNPAVFIMGIQNGCHNAPFFSTRFREALFHYSSLFDMFEANIPREAHERMLLENLVIGRKAMNVIACEGAERIERPETYKQWQLRNTRAGFVLLPLDREMLATAKEKVKSSYHEDFVVDEDGNWMLQGWKGRIIYALSTWKPAQ